MLTDLKISLLYAGYGETIKNDFYLPVLRNSVSYNRLSAYFSIQSLVNVAEGIECMMKKEGSVKLVLGYHDIPRELLKAKLAENLWNEKLMNSFGSK